MSHNLIIKSEPQFTEQEFIGFLLKQGITVKTNTKARGNLGICLKNRIDISKKADKGRRLAILAHEYAHKIHFDLEKELFNRGGSLEILFKTSETGEIFEELIQVTYQVDENSRFTKFNQSKEEIFRNIKELTKLIKREYPDFKRSYPFKPANSYFRKNKTPAKYLLKYDNVKIVQPVFNKENIYSIRNIDSDFPDIPEYIRTYIKLKHFERKYKRLYRMKNKAQKYYRKPTELFARFIEGLFIDKALTEKTAPVTYSRFIELLNQGYYGNLKELFHLAGLEL